MHLHLIRVKRNDQMYSFKTIAQLKNYWRCDLTPATSEKLLNASLTYEVVSVTIRYNILTIGE